MHRRPLAAHERVLLPIALAGLLAAACSAGGPFGGGAPGAIGGGAPSGQVSSSLPDTPVTATPIGGGLPGAVGQPQPSLVFPRPNVLDPHPVPIQALRQVPSDGRVVVRAEWWSGVEPCNALSAVKVARDGDRFTLTVMEGSLAVGVACPEIAQAKATLVDLGQLPAGTYTVVADPGDALPLTILVD